LRLSTVVEVQNIDGDWSFVKASGGQGWVYSAYLREEGTWFMIRNKDKKEGWVSSLYLRRV
jgi:SH3-like domain-containing protein